MRKRKWTNIKNDTKFYFISIMRIKGDRQGEIAKSSTK